MHSRKHRWKCIPSILRRIWNTTNINPVSLLTSFSKSFEKVIYNRLLQHTNENNIIDMDQYGFKTNSSTELAIFKLVNQTWSHITNKSPVCGIFCDLTKAFDLFIFLFI